MEPVIIGTALGIAAAVVVKTLTDTAGRVKGWYGSSVKDSLWELAGVLAVLGAVVGAVWARSRS
jgi:H+/Cl- antiporter ClcA